MSAPGEAQVLRIAERTSPRVCCEADTWHRALYGMTKEAEA